MPCACRPASAWVLCPAVPVDEDHALQRSPLPAPDLRLEWGGRLQRRLLTVERLGLRPVHSILRLSPSGAHAACPCPPEGSMGPVSRELSNCPCSVVLGGGSTTNAQLHYCIIALSDAVPLVTGGPSAKRTNPC